MATTAWKNAGTATSIDVGGDPDTEWTNLGNITAEDGSYVNNTADWGQAKEPCDKLRSTNFGFTMIDIPYGATIDGIEMKFKRYFTRAGAGNNMEDADIRLILSGSSIGVDKSTGTTWPRDVGNSAFATYGGAADVWSTSLSASNIWDTTFGIDIRPNWDGALYTGICYVDVVQIRIHFTRGRLALFGGATI